ncbi:membrane protease subunit 1 [Seminavis robusta]|uniref:Membrane protease subunit 1 n=1 Tax=Seminavis robusta TaxID=568900 RepID=A0A9N8F084_9STRA|nr:membrane protease subunit 1 [Seminavis robusta]|eukprot:Sro2890_g339550.1 membrane protease subunit 1 (421) ;mRNA; f:5445-6707
MMRPWSLACSVQCQWIKQPAFLLKGSHVNPPFQRRYLATKGRGGGLKRTKGGGFARNKKAQERPPKNARGKAKEDEPKPTLTPPKKHWTNDPDRLWAYRQHAWTTVAQRGAPLLVLSCVVAFSEEGNQMFYSYLCPLQMEQLSGPSMLPSIHPWGDVWLHTTPMWDSLRQLYHSAKEFVTGNPSPLYQCGQIVIWRDPQTNRRSCKRIVGMGGDTVQRYGQFAEYYRHRPDLGVRWETLQARGLDPSCPWDTQSTTMDDPGLGDSTGEPPQHHSTTSLSPGSSTSQTEQRHDDDRLYHSTRVVPKGHVWLEGDNPLLSVDSRHYGPVPLSYLEGKLVWRLWPLLRHPAIRKHDQMLLKHRHIRPQPLDVETPKQRGQEDRLALYYNLHCMQNQQPQRDPPLSLDEPDQAMEFTSNASGRG